MPSVPGLLGHVADAVNVGMLKRFDVTLVTGETLQVQSAQERNWFERSKRQYLTENKFTEHTDMVDLDRLLCLELLAFRWNQHLAGGVDYEECIVDEELLRRKLKDQTEAITRLKSAMGLTKEARNKVLEAGNFAEYVARLRQRAKEFGVKREEELRHALVLMNELSAIVGSYDRSDQEERRKLGFETEHEILQWVRETMLPEFRRIDAYFREHKQRFWKQEDQ